MSDETSKFHTRSANSAGDDVEFIVAAWDSTLPYLASVGAGEMWGDQPFSRREGFQEDIAEVVRRAEKNSKSDERRLLVAEAGDIPVGAVMIRDALPYYITEREELQAQIKGNDSFLFIEALISDHRPQPRHRGVGAALIAAVKRRAADSGKKAVYVDAWAGNNRRLNRQVVYYLQREGIISDLVMTRYYEDQGFTNVGDFSFARRNKPLWLGTLYRIDL